MLLVSGGAELKRILLVVVPRLVPVKVTVAPGLRVRLPNVREAFWPLPGLTLIVEWPPARVRVWPPAKVWLDVAEAEPTRENVPPLSVTGVALARRLVLLAAELSSLRVPPL